VNFSEAFGLVEEYNTFRKKMKDRKINITKDDDLIPEYEDPELGKL
jgi:hypothetical protein